MSVQFIIGITSVSALAYIIYAPSSFASSICYEIYNQSKKIMLDIYEAFFVKYPYNSPDDKNDNDPLY